MTEEKTLLLSYGVEGGGSSLYRLTNGKIMETGSSGGMLLEEEEDPIKSWKNDYDSIDDWSDAFLNDKDMPWLTYHFMDIHEEMKPILLEALNATKPEDAWQKDRHKSLHWKLTR